MITATVISLDEIPKRYLHPRVNNRTDVDEWEYELAIWHRRMDLLGYQPISHPTITDDSAWLAFKAAA